MISYSHYWSTVAFHKNQEDSRGSLFTNSVFVLLQLVLIPPYCSFHYFYGTISHFWCCMFSLKCIKKLITLSLFHSFSFYLSVYVLACIINSENSYSADGGYESLKLKVIWHLASYWMTDLKLQLSAPCTTLLKIWLISCNWGPLHPRAHLFWEQILTEQKRF